ncbi:MAG: hypothetical protein AAFZ49_02660, partial [Cyanobacteria bacterium J06659_2]
GAAQIPSHQEPRESKYPWVAMMAVILKGLNSLAEAEVQPNEIFVHRRSLGHSCAETVQYGDSCSLNLMLMAIAH